MSSLLSSIGTNSSLEEIVTRITNTNPANERDTASLQVYLKSSAKDAVLASAIPGQGNQDPLGLLNPSSHTLGYLYILTARLSINNSLPVSNEQLLSFVTQFNPSHAQLAPERMVILAKKIWKRAESSSQPTLAVLPLRHLVSKYPPDRSDLSPIHPIFLTACLHASAPNQALPILSTPITSLHARSLPPSSSSSIASTSSTYAADAEHYLTYMDNLLYHFLGGILLCMLKRWTLAEQFFEICAASPVYAPNCASALQIEAVKKLVLVQLIIYGKTRPLPKYTSLAVQRALKATPYTALLRSYPYYPPAQTYAPSDKEIRILKDDGNLGLVKQVLDRAVRWRIHELTETYVTLDLGEVCDMVGISKIEEGRVVVLGMIQQNEISASLAFNAGAQEETLTFHVASSSVKSDMHTAREIQDLLETANLQGQELARLERELSTNKEYLVKALKGSREDIYPDDQMEMYNQRDWDDMRF